MILRQIFDLDTYTYTYLIASDIGGEAVIIDPVRFHIDKYIKTLDELDLKLVAAIDTHTHADHVTAAGILREKTNCDIVAGVKSDAKFVTKSIKDGDTIDFGGLSLKAIYTPGHTSDSYSYLLGDKVFTGDVLLIRGTGRTDFQGGSSDAQYDSITNKLFTLDDNTTVYPGHDYNGNLISTIWEEKKFNPRISGKTSKEFAEIMDNLHLPTPNYMDIALPANLRSGL